MSRTTRIILGIVVIAVIIGGVLVTDHLQRQKQAETLANMPPGAIPIYIQEKFYDAFVPDDLSDLEGASFVDDEEGKTQEGWMLRDILRLYINAEDLKPDSAIIVSSSSREKSIELTWADVDEPENMVMFDLSGRGTLKLVSKSLPNFSLRDDWVQDVDKIEIYP
ncbi:hypothetical protein KQH54_04080 [bacterium]|nr:hypothetical protein [bacterium]